MHRFMPFGFALASFVTFVGCSAATEAPGNDDGFSDESSSAVKPRICPAIYDPVCGKDGKTYSNTCAAGGPHRVAYEGECVNPCAAVLCMVGTVCEVKGNKPVCVPSDEPPPFDPCMTVKCMAGYHCESVQVQCITTPCDPIAQCVPTLCDDPAGCGPALGMPNTLCSDGVTVSGPTGNCLDYGDTCGWEVLSCP